ncbi:MAG: MerR family DNA-binding protein, partial [Burkholderiales bacterium]
MRIGELGMKTGLATATIRYYEQSGLLDKPARSESNYRRYGSQAVARLGFVRRCRSLGISLAETRRLVELAAAPDANCAEVDVLLDEHIRNVREQRRSLAKLERELKMLRADCHPSRQVRGCGILRDSALGAGSRGERVEGREPLPQP